MFSITAPEDAVAVLSYLNAFGPTKLPVGAQVGEPYGFMDVTVMVRSRRRTRLAS